MKSHILTLGALSTLPILGMSENTDVQTPKKQPNIILCMADDLGWGDVGFNGNKIIKTPNLDKLAEDGVKFTRFYAAAPVCSPTRASCLIGRNPFRTGVFSANMGILRPEEVTIAEVLKKEGYSTGHFGKWHLGTLTDKEKDANRGGTKHPELLNPPNLHGFDEYFSTESKVPTWDPMKVPANFNKKRGENLRFGWDYLKDGQKFEHYGTSYWKTNGEKETENLSGDDSRVIMDRAIPFIEKSVSGGKPFLTVIWFHAPHLPCVAGPKYAEMYKGQNFEMQQYAGCITAIDDQMGRLRQKLKDLGVADDTIICFTSDNGPERRTPGVSGGYKEIKRSLHEGGVRVPGFITWPAKVKQGFETNYPAVTSDYLPTVIDILGLEKPKNKLDGTSLLPLFEGKTPNRPTPIGFASLKQQAWNGKKYKLYRSNGDKIAKLYDIENDPFETKDIASSHPELLQEYTKNLGEWYEDCESSFKGAEYGTESLERVKQKWPEVKK